MATCENVLHAIGNTPMVKLRRMAGGGADVFVKCEYTSPGGSIKDRMAVHIVRKAMERGDLKPGGVIVENTSGNTGTGLALIAAVHGFRLILTMPDKMSQEKIDTLRAFGAKVVVTPTNVPAEHPDSYYETARRIAAEIPGAFYVNQYHNLDNIEAHYLSTGPEIWRDMDSRLDAIVIGVGTGGTISGVGKYIKEQDPSVKVIGVDPVGSVFYDMFKTGRMVTPRVYKVEGIGEDMMCGALEMSVIDDMFQVNDKQCFVHARRLAREEGIYAGGSSGGAVAIALEVARKLEAGKRVVAILPDHGDRYLSKLFNDEWMRVNGFLDDDQEASAQDVIGNRGGNVVWVTDQETLRGAAEVLKNRDVSQAPVHDGAGRLVGCITEGAILSALVAGSAQDTPVSAVMGKKPPVVAPQTPLSTASELLLGQPAVLVGTGNEVRSITGILSKIDLVEFLSSRM